MYLFFDTETTGLPKRWDAPVSDLSNWPRMVQIAWLQYSTKGEKITGQDYIIKPEGFTIPIEASRVHGISTERAVKEGVFLEMVLKEFSDLINASSLLVAHNMNFDEKIIGAEFLRKGIENSLLKTDRLCTMRASTDYCALPGKSGFKWPKLDELHSRLFGTGFEEAHNAAADIEACARCFWELKKRNIM